MSAGRMRIGVDTGGTFTDFVCLDEGPVGARLRVHKLRSTPEDPSQAILAGTEEMMGAALSSLHVEMTHGSTVATNAVLERRGARVALLTTAGFEDVLRIGRQTRPELYNFMVRRAEPLVETEQTLGVHERTVAGGRVLKPLNDAEVQRVLQAVEAMDVESVAVCFLHSYANDEHERRMAEALRARGYRVSTSAEVLPEYREYERWSTTVVNAYVAPLMARYLHRLQDGLGSATLRIMQSNGGSISAARAGSEAVQTILSGPAAGVVGAQAVAAASGVHQLITFDMGGTSTDVSLLNGEISTTAESLVGDLPVRLPVLDIHTVGAGGGSIAWIDSGGGLRVGPRSAGAEPGPVCFGKGEHLTVTDANLLLGRLDPEYFLGGRMALDLVRTQRVAAEFAQTLGLSAVELAEGIVKIANANMERAVRVVSVQRGFDPREFALLAFGGAGGLHACDLAASLEMRTVLIPEHSGVLSALGMLLADVVKTYSASVLRRADALSWSELMATLGPLTSRANDDLQREGFSVQQTTLIATLSMRYTGQSFELDVTLPHRRYVGDDVHDTGDKAPMAEVIAEFHRKHGALYGYADVARATEVVQLRLRAIGRTEKPMLAQGICEEAALPGPAKVTQAIFAGRSTATPVYHRNQLAAGMRGEGPTIIVSGESTNVIPPDWMWQIDAAGTLVAHSDEAMKGRSYET